MSGIRLADASENFRICRACEALGVALAEYIAASGSGWSACDPDSGEEPGPPDRPGRGDVRLQLHRGVVDGSAVNRLTDDDLSKITPLMTAEVFTTKDLLGLNENALAALAQHHAAAAEAAEASLKAYRLLISLLVGFLESGDTTFGPAARRARADADRCQDRLMLARAAQAEGLLATYPNFGD